MTGRRLFLRPLLVCGCRGWSPINLAPAQSGLLPSHARIVRRGGERVELHGGLVSPDSVVGTRRDGGYLAIPRDSVVLVEAPHTDSGRTLIVVGLLGGLAALLGAAYSIRD